MKDDELDTTIRAALSAESNQWLSDLDPPVHEMIIEVFQGKTRWLAALGFFLTLAFFGLGVFSAFQFFNAETTREMIGWATGFLFSATTVALIKVWYWMELSKNALTREIKRFELQLARITNQMNE